MKKLLCFAILLAASFGLQAQSSSGWVHEDTSGRDPLTYHMVFEKFRPGVVTYADGSNSTALLNYCILTQEFVFAQNGTILLVKNPEKIASVVIDSTVFVPKVPGKGEFLIALRPGEEVGLFVEHQGTATPQERTDSYGSVLPGTSNGRLASMNIGNFSTMPALPHDVKVKQMDKYYVKLQGKHVPFHTNKEIEKAFPEKAAGLKAFLKKEKNRLKTETEYLAVYDYCMGR